LNEISSNENEFDDLRACNRLRMMTVDVIVMSTADGIVVPRMMGNDGLDSAAGDS
jgi:hypothetical protein